MDNVPVRTNNQAHAPRHEGASNGNKFKRNKAKLAGIAAAVVAVLLIVGAIGWFLYQSSPRAAIDSSKYQAVFFTNGQVYFGKLQALNSGYFKLVDIFYLQAQSAKSSQNPQASSGSTPTSDVQLIKLGGEIHGPMDEMIINKDQLLFFENLKPDGKVSQTIINYQAPKK